MATTTVNAVLKYWPGGVAGEARQGVLSGSNYSGQMGFDFSAIGDLTNINISSITLTFHVGALGGAYTKYLYLKHGGRNGPAVGNYSFTGCYNTNKSITFTASNNVAGFNALKAYIEGISGSSVVILGVNNTGGSRGSGSGKSYDYDYMNITSASLALTYTYKKSTGSIGDLTITSASGNTASLKITSYNSSYSHKVTWKVGSWSKTNSVAAGVTPATQVIIPDRLPNATSGTGTVILETLNGSTSLGSNTYTFNVKIGSGLTPSIGTFTAAPVYDSSVTNTAQGWGLYIQGKTKATVTMGSVAAGAGATIKSYSITSSPNFGSGTSSSLTSGFLTGTGNVVFTAKVTDSRGRTATKTVTVNVQAYAPPKISAASVIRCTQTGTAAETDGTYAKITATYSCSSIKSGSSEKNSLTATGTTHKCELNGLSNNSISSGTAFILGADSGSTGALSTDTAYTAKITLTDLVGGTTTYTLTVPSAAYIIHVRKGGKSMGIGKAASTTANRLDIKWATEMEGTLTVKNEIAAQPDSGRAYVRIIPAQDQHGDITFGRSGNQIWALSGRNSTDKFFGLFNYGLSEWAMRIDETTDALTLAKPLTIANGGHGKTTAAAGFAALSDPQLNVAWKDAPVGISHYFYESSTAAADYDLPYNYVEVIVMKRNSERGVALAYRWSNQSGGIWKNNLHGSWQGWVADGDYYRTGEEAIGTWTDGKVLYRYSCTGSTTSTGDITTSQTLPRTPDSIIKITGGFYSSADSAWRPIPFVTYYNINQAFSAVVTSDNKVHLYIGSGLTGTKTWKLVIEYTA